jgi:hypothetical protein
LVGAGLLLGWLQIEIAPNKPESGSIGNNEPLPIQLPQGTVDPAATSTVVSPAAKVVPSPILKSNQPATLSDAVTVAGRLGALRVSNQTQHPVRVALLSKQPQTRGMVAAKALKPDYSPPAHWDFAPEEGAKRGLLLSLPHVDLKLQPGDVLVAFAEDGSRLYWGPYVVGETIAPIWDSQTAEWQLILQ